MNRIARRFLICAGIILLIAIIDFVARNAARCPGESIKIGDAMLMAGCP